MGCGFHAREPLRKPHGANMENTVTLTSLTGRRFAFNVHDKYSTTWNEVPALYAFASYTLLGGWHIQYIGQAGNLKERMSNHERWLEAANAGAAHVLARVASPNETIRKDEERDLIANYQPPLNQQIHRNYLADLLAGMYQVSQPALGNVLTGLGSPGRHGKGSGGR